MRAMEREESPEARTFLSAPLQLVDVGSAQIAYRAIGAGPPLLLLHGWPLSGFTFRKLVPHLAPRFTCYLPDTPGAGESRWRDDHDFRFAGQAAAYARFVDALGLDRFALLGHDTGATIGRRLALDLGGRVEKLVLIGTEIPGHRPPFIPLYQKVTALPGAGASLRLLLRWRAFRRSSMGFGGCFHDLSLLDGEFHAHFVQPLCDSAWRMEGQIRYLRGIDWQLVDGLAERHREIRAPSLLIWGRDDPVFPVERARAMAAQLGDCRGFEVVDGARLLVHEERPEEVARRSLTLLAPG
jgi:pimeloyl-ACP methyl ester carboxylesterase